MVDSSSEVSWFEEVDGVKVGDVDTPGVGLGALRPVLLDVHPKEADVNSVLLLKGEHSARDTGNRSACHRCPHTWGKTTSTPRLYFVETIQLQHNFKKNNKM